ncbi:MAG TPA: DUF2235 domain-containing protein [Thermoanaerobaculia bacterium]|nr:DUF2235 domain-containing protein [Thermoanaerobaculia bacterium]
MGKNIIVCSDGTGNSGIKGRGTNVFKLFEAIDLNGHRHDPALDPQVAFYDDGVGTEQFKVLKLFAGATGWGLSRNVQQLYKEIVRIYDPGDRLFLFGFSRGAFTVRTLVGLIHTCGILNPARFKTAEALEAAVSGAYRLYRKNYRTALAKLFLGPPDSSRVDKFRKENCSAGDVDIRFLGVWDTVDGVGLPFHLSDFVNLTIHRFKFPDRKLSACVKHACHALAIDDERHSFHPLLWEDDPRIEQVWFAGAHSNVGGGYPKQGMSLVTLDWMMAKAEKDGLRLVGSERALYRDLASVDDKLYNPRAGAGMFYRWKPRDIAAMCERLRIPPVLHMSVLERIAHGTNDYAPGNLPPDAEVVITPSREPHKDGLALERAKEVGRVFRSAHQEGKPLLARTRSAVVAGMLSYYLFLLTLLGTVFAVSAPAAGGTGMEHVKSAGVLLGRLATLQLGEVGASLGRIPDKPWLVLLLICGYLLSGTLAVAVNRRMSNVFSEFWHDQQLSLRNALKRAREEAKELQAGPKRTETKAG